jgi:hypothetical protein
MATIRAKTLHHVPRTVSAPVPKCCEEQRNLPRYEQLHLGAVG